MHYINLLDIKNPRLVFSNDDVQSEKVNEVHTFQKYCKTIVNLSEAELEKHKNFLKKELKKNNY